VVLVHGPLAAVGLDHEILRERACRVVAVHLHGAYLAEEEAHPSKVPVVVAHRDRQEVEEEGVRHRRQDDDIVDHPILLHEEEGHPILGEDQDDEILPVVVEDHGRLWPDLLVVFVDLHFVDHDRDCHYDDLGRGIVLVPGHDP